MMPVRIAGANTKFGGPGFLTIDVLAEVIEGQKRHTLALEPTPDELVALLGGARVHLTILGDGWPPVLVGVGTPVSPAIQLPASREQAVAMIVQAENYLRITQ